LTLQLLLFNNSKAFGVSDTLKRRNIIQLGVNGTSFFDGYDFAMDNSIIFMFRNYRFFRFSEIINYNGIHYFSYLSYKRFFGEKHCLLINLELYSKAYSSIGVIGQPLARHYKNVSVGYGRVYYFKKVKAIIIGQMDYREGFEIISLGYNIYHSNSPFFGFSGLQSIGVSSGVDISYSLTKRFTVGVNSFYHKYFDYSMIQFDPVNPSIYKTYMSNTEMYTLNIYAGYAF